MVAEQDDKRYTVLGERQTSHGMRLLSADAGDMDMFHVSNNSNEG